MAHKFKREQAKDGGTFSRCTCGQYVSPKAHMWQVEDAENLHLENVQRAMAALSRREPTLKNQRDYYLQMAVAEEVSEADRRMWQQLADEISRRIGDGSQCESETLFQMEPNRKAGDRP